MAVPVNATECRDDKNALLISWSSSYTVISHLTISSINNGNKVSLNLNQPVHMSVLSREEGVTIISPLV